MNLTSSYSRVGVYSNENYYLSKYLGSKSLDLANHIYWFLKWDESEEILDRAGVNREELEELQGEYDDRLYEVCDQILKVMSADEQEEFAENLVQRDPTEAPTWAHTSLEEARLPRQTWLVHFSDQTGNIVDEGFTRGVDDMEKVALTTWLHDHSKKYGGYNFAFVAGDRHSQNAAYTKKYGDSAVMFQSSGVEVYHYGDQENQVIFWGKAIDSKTIVELGRDGNEWQVVPRYKSPMNQKGRDFVYKGEFKDVVNWVEKHWFQYRNQIMGK